MPDTTIAENIRLYRMRGGYTQKQFAEALGISAATLSSYETGKTMPGVDIICKIATMCKVSPDEVVGFRTPDSEEEAMSSLAASFKVKN